MSPVTCWWWMEVSQPGKRRDKAMNIPLTPVRFLRYAEQQFPGKTAVVCGDRRFTYAQFGERASRLAGALREAGAKVHTGVKVLFLEKEFAEVVDSFRQSVSNVQNFFMLDAAPQGAWLSPGNYEDILAAATPYRADVMDFNENSLAELFYTSGTSADPKGVMLTHRNVYLHALSVIVTFMTKPDSVNLHTIPLFHANGWGTAHSVTFVGGKHVMLQRFTCAEVFQLIQRERVDSLSLVPIMATALVNSPDRQKYDLSSLEWISIGGAASSPTLVRETEEKLGCVCFAGYGLTETAPVLSTAKLKPGEQFDGGELHVARAMTGYAIPGVELRVVDFEDNDVARDGKTMGEIVARSHW